MWTVSSLLLKLLLEERRAGYERSNSGRILFKNDILCNDSTSAVSTIYEALQHMPDQQPWADDIDKDLDRQFPGHEMFAKGTRCELLNLCLSQPSSLNFDS